MSIASKLLEVNDIKRDLSAAISEVSSTAAGVETAGLTEIPSYINNIVLKEPLTEPKDINFIDYDGTLLYAYTADEFIAQNSLPTPPPHKGLVFEEWNWDLADLLEYAGNGIRVDVGALYITDDRKTRVYVTKDAKVLDQKICFYQNKANGVTVEWGDGSQSTSGTITNINTLNILTHTYTEPGDYVISLSLVSGCSLYIGLSNVNNGTYGIVGSVQNEAKYLRQVSKVELGEKVYVRGGMVRGCGNLKSVTTSASTVFPTNITSYSGTALRALIIPRNCTGGRLLDGCTSAKYLCAPKTANYGYCCNYNSHSLDYVFIYGNPGYGALYCNYSLTRIDFLPSCTTISDRIANECYSLKRVYVPETVTSIAGTSNFAHCWNAIEIIVKGSVSSIPNNFCTNCFSACIIDLPASITSIGTQAFMNCYRCQTLIVRATTPPTLANMNAFTGLIAKQSGADAKFTVIQDLVKIYVPYSSDHSVLNAYKTATNWSTWADRFVELDTNGNIGS